MRARYADTHKKIKATVAADHRRQVHLVAHPTPSPRAPTIGVLVQMGPNEKRRVIVGGQATVAWISMGGLRKLRAAIDKILARDYPRRRGLTHSGEPIVRRKK